MVNGAFHFRPAPGDLCLERGDTLAQFLDREGIKVLAGELPHRIVVSTRKNLVGVHPAKR